MVLELHREAVDRFLPLTAALVEETDAVARLGNGGIEVQRFLVGDHRRARMMGPLELLGAREFGSCLERRALDRRVRRRLPGDQERGRLGFGWRAVGARGNPQGRGRKRGSSAARERQEQRRQRGSPPHARTIAEPPRPQTRRSPAVGEAPGWANADSAAGEVRLALLDVGRQSFLGIVALEELLLQLALDRERALERDLDAALHRALDASHRLGGAIRRTEALGVLLDLLQELVVARGLPDLVHEPELLA